jgi:abortive infection bacteriophage resistance protein
MDIIKQPKTFEEQVEILKERGCLVSSSDFLIDLLKRVNYYRLTGYLYLFRCPDGRYVDGTSIEKIAAVYEFDQKLRNLLFEAIGEIEIEAKTKIAYYHAHKYGPLGYMDESNFNDKHEHDDFKAKVESTVANNTKLSFVKHHKDKYEGNFPIWVIVEIFTLGMTSTFYADLPACDKKEIAKQYGIPYMHLQSWLHSLTVLRNICAHYGRLYATSFRKVPKLPKSYTDNPDFNPNLLYAQICMLKLLYINRKDAWNNSILGNIVALTQQYSKHLNFKALGFLENWDDALRWTE